LGSWSWWCDYGIAIWRFLVFCMCLCERISWMGVLVELLLCEVGERWLVGWCEMG
jgi:hypothetical protein